MGPLHSPDQQYQTDITPNSFNTSNMKISVQEFVKSQVTLDLQVDNDQFIET